MYEKVIDRILSEYAEHKKQEMRDILDCSFLEELSTGSPIEKVFYAAITMLIDSIGLGGETVVINNKPERLGVDVDPQYQIGKYRVDFLCTYHRWPSEPIKRVVVECDGHVWHERTEAERSKEKRRDRFLQCEGYTVFRFTGKELLKSPIQCVVEVVEFLVGYKIHGGMK